MGHGRLWLRIAAIGAICVGLVMLTASNRLHPEVMSARVGAFIQAKTGYGVSVSGPLKRTYFPWFGFHTGPIRIDDGDTLLLSLKSLMVRVRLWPLLFGDISLDRIILQEPRLTMVRQPADADSNGDDKPGGGAGSTILKDLSIAGFTVRDGSMVLKEANSSDEIRISGLYLSTGALSHRSPFGFELNGSVIASAAGAEADIDMHGVLRLDFESGETKLSDGIVKAAITGAAIPQQLGRLDVLTTLDYDHAPGAIMANPIAMTGEGMSVSGSLNGRDIFNAPAIDANLQATLDKERFTPSIFEDIQAQIRVNGQQATATLEAEERGPGRMRLDLMYLRDASPKPRLTVGGELSGFAARAVPGMPPTLDGLLFGRFAVDAVGSNLDELLEGVNMNLKTIVTDKAGQGRHNYLNLQALVDYDLDRGTLAVDNGRVDFAKSRIRFGANVVGLDGDFQRVRGYMDGQRLDVNSLLGLYGAKPVKTEPPELLQDTSLKFGFASGPTRTNIKKLHLQIGDFNLRGGGEWRRNMRSSLKFKLFGDRLDLDRFTVADTENADKKDQGPTSLRFDGIDEFIVDGSLALDELALNDMSIRNVHLTTAAKPGLPARLGLKADLASGKLNGRVQGDFAPLKPEFKMRLRYDGGKLGSLMQSLANDPYITGNLEVFADLSGAGADTAELAGSLKGRSGVTVTGGRINQFADDKGGWKRHKKRG